MWVCRKCAKSRRNFIGVERKFRLCSKCREMKACIEETHRQEAWKGMSYTTKQLYFSMSRQNMGMR